MTAQPPVRQAARVHGQHLPSTLLDLPRGTFAQDWEYVAGSGDVDECNGRTGVTPEFTQGIYHYFSADTYPDFQRCVQGQASVTIHPPGPS